MDINILETNLNENLEHIIPIKEGVNNIKTTIKKKYCTIEQSTKNKFYFTDLGNDKITQGIA
jgi:hypothetical protein